MAFTLACLRRAAPAMLVAGWIVSAPAAEPIGAIGEISPTLERVVVDSRTGLAIAGFDPVAYFIDGEPRLGSRDYEAVWSGAVWRFANDGNRAAFVSDPEIYAPSFGGYCAGSAALGLAVRGDPLVWSVEAGRLLFFRSALDLSSWQASGPDRLARADANWPGLMLALAP